MPSLSDPSYVMGNKEEYPVITWWANDFYPHDESDFILQCPLGKCHVTDTREYHSTNLTATTTSRAYVFYGTLFRADDLPLPRLPHHEWALVHEESPKNNWILSTPLGIR